jgi:hypothetical protein
VYQVPVDGAADAPVVSITETNPTATAIAALPARIRRVRPDLFKKRFMVSFHR